MRIINALSFGIALWTAAAPCSALTFAFSYTATNAEGPLAASGLLDTADALNAAGGYSITGISGSVDGDPIVTLTPNAAEAAASTSPDGKFTYDNTVFPSAPFLGNAGVLFTSASGFEYNLFSNSTATYELYQAAYGNYTAHSVGTLILADVPEPTTWALMLTGFVMVGFAARRRRLSRTA